MVVYQDLQLRSDYLTPIFHTELLHARKLLEETLQHPDPTIFEQPHASRLVENLDITNEQLTEHWDNLHTSIRPRISLLSSTAYQQFLAMLLLTDYSGHSQREAIPVIWISKLIAILNKDYCTAEKFTDNVINELYLQVITTPIKEMMLDQNNIEKRIRIAAAQQYPTGEIYRLIDECDWPNLATMLVEDRRLAVTLRDQQSVDPTFDIGQISKLALREMDETRDRYFSELSRPFTYTTSKHARDRSARKAAGLPLSSEPPSRHSMGEWASAAAKGVYKEFIGSLGLGTATSRPRPTVPSGSSDGSSRSSTRSTSQQPPPYQKIKLYWSGP
jgi:hypothetical protein